MKVTRIERSQPGAVGTEDGYVYRWDEPGQAIDVLAQHQSALLAMPGFAAVEVELVDEPVILPAFTDAAPADATLVPPAVAVEPAVEVTAAFVGPAEMPAPVALPDTTVRPKVEASPLLEVNVSPLWSASDVALLEAQGLAP